MARDWFKILHDFDPQLNLEVLMCSMTNSYDYHQLGNPFFPTKAPSSNWYSRTVC